MGKIAKSSFIISAMVKMSYKSSTVLDEAGATERIIGKLLYNYHVGTLPDVEIYIDQDINKVFKDIDEAITKKRSKKNSGNLEHLAELLLGKSQPNNSKESNFATEAKPLMENFWKLITKYELERQARKATLGLA